MKLIALDPGPIESAYVVWGGDRILDHGKADNATIVEILVPSDADRCVIEMIASYGMAVGREVFETCVWIGRFMECFGPERCERLTRIQVKNHICHSSRANDSNIRTALLDRFGGKEKAIGRKASPGPLYGVVKDQLAALAVALTYYDQHAGSL
jgi:hypothetical protein